MIKNHKKALKLSQGTTLAEHSNRNNALLAAVEITAVQINTKKTQGRKKLQTQHVESLIHGRMCFGPRLGRSKTLH